MSLTASLTIEPSEADAPEAFVARFRLVNQGDDVVGINLAVLSSPSLAFEITDAAGEPVLLPPPPVPPESPPIEPLEAAEETTAEFAGFLPRWTEPGRYRARSPTWADRLSPSIPIGWSSP